MKKLISLLLCVAMVMSMSAISFADGEGEILINSLQFKRGSGEDYYVKNDIVDGRYAASLNLTNTYGTDKDVIVITALYNGGETRLSNVNYQTITVKPGTDFYQTDDVNVSGANENSEIKTMIWDETYSPIVTPLYFSNQGSDASLAACSITLETENDYDGKDEVTYSKLTRKAYLNTESNTFRVYFDNFEMMSDAEREKDPVTGAAISRMSRDTMNYAHAVYRSLTEDYPTLIKNIAPDFTVSGGKLLNDKARDLSTEQLYTVIDDEGRIKTYTLCVTETSLINQSSYNQTPTVLKGDGFAQAPNGGGEVWTRRGVSSWSRVGWLGQNEYDYSGNKWTWDDVGNGNYAITFNKNVSSVPYDWNLLTGAAGYVSSNGIKDTIVTFTGRINSLEGKGMYIGGTLAGYVNGTVNPRAGRHALVFQPGFPEDMVDIKYIEGLENNIITTADSANNTAKYYDILSIPGNPQVEIGQWHEYTMIYKNTGSTSLGFNCSVELYIDGEYVAELPSWYDSRISPNFHQSHIIIGGYSGAEGEGTTYSFSLDGIDIQYHSTNFEYYHGTR